MVFRIAAIIIGLAAIGIAIHNASNGTFTYRALWPVALGITFVAYGFGSKRKGSSHKLPIGTQSQSDSELHKEVPKGVEKVVKVISVLIIIFISLF
ncbi:hypothetical protein ACFL4N_09885, partial [Thermodesulfobacteriota bacterium]